MKNYMLLPVALVLLSCSEWHDDIYRNDETVSDTIPVTSNAEPGQLYNMNFDSWSKDGTADVCYGSDASEWDRSIWGSANKTTAGLGYATCTMESEFVAVSGDNKCAVKLQSRYINVLITKKFAAGALFTGQMGNINISKMNAALKWGVPFTYKPKSLEGYACYRPVNIDHVKPPYENKKGDIDNGHIFVVLADWDQQFIVDPAEDQFLDVDNDPGIIGYGKVSFDHYMENYEKFKIDIEYRNDRTPRYVVIVASSSALGDYFTGADGSVLYMDELAFIY